MTAPTYLRLQGSQAYQPAALGCSISTCSSGHVYNAPGLLPCSGAEPANSCRRRQQRGGSPADCLLLPCLLSSPPLTIDSHLTGAEIGANVPCSQQPEASFSSKHLTAAGCLARLVKSTVPVVAMIASCGRHESTRHTPAARLPHEPDQEVTRSLDHCSLICDGILDNSAQLQPPLAEAPSAAAPAHSRLHRR